MTQYKRIESLEEIITKRTGGSVNFRGINFQTIYACYLILAEFADASTISTIRLEGIEDIDIMTADSSQNKYEHVQVKSSVNKMDAGSFWNLGVLQNFMEVYTKSPTSRFRLIYNMKIAKGELAELFNNFYSNISNYWIEKLKSLDPKIDAQDFFNRVLFENRSKQDLEQELSKLLLRDWNVSIDTQEQFIRSLYYKVLCWSEERQTIERSDLVKLFQEIRDSFSKSPINKAITYNWISRTIFIADRYANEDYYEGKSARPSHIALQLPVQRKSWLGKITEGINENDVVVIKASSGQGKSTLAWQAAYDYSKINSIYELHQCSNIDAANDIASFLETRVAIGELPIVIIDGLSESVAKWYKVIEMTRKVPVKYIITTREEDWFRYGADMSRIRVNILNISLSMEEARDIYQQFKKNNKIHPASGEWQSCWESVYRSGLLIEYVYLLTRGAMMHDRLYSQIKLMSSRPTASAKIEVLRLVSVADSLGLKLLTSNVLAHIETKFRLDIDRDSLLNELTNEYYLNFEGWYITGLHPIRSNHLSEILHSNFPVAMTILDLYALIEVDYKKEYFLNMPRLLKPKDKEHFYRGLAELLKEGKLLDMVYALDGIMYAEPEIYYLANKNLFDQAFLEGGLELFIMDTIPYANLNSLKEFDNVIGNDNPTLKNLLKLKELLSQYNIKGQEVSLFAGHLAKALSTRKSKLDSFDGLNFITKWAKILGLQFELPITPIKEFGIDSLIAMDLEKILELAAYYQISDSNSYFSFIDLNKYTIISYLKKHTRSLGVKEIDNEMHIKYIPDHEEMGNTNNASVKRIQAFQALLPIYKCYCTEAIILPFPSENIISATKGNSIKKLTTKGLGDTFDIHINRIWHDSMSSKFQASSSYEWQKGMLDIRKIFSDWCKAIVRYVDSLFQLNLNNRESSIAHLNNLRIRLDDAIRTKRSYPKYGHAYFGKKNIIHEIYTDKWLFALGNINKQLNAIFLSEHIHDRNIALINLKDVYTKLNKMQNEFAFIADSSIEHFETEQILTEEKKCMESLYSTIQYYVSKAPLKSTDELSVPRKSINEWWLKAKTKNFDDLIRILDDIANAENTYIYTPSSIHETSTLSYATIGISQDYFSNDERLTNFSIAFSKLGDLSFDFYTFVGIKDNNAITALRFKKQYFEAFLKLAEGEILSIDGLMPFPVNLDSSSIAMLDGITLRKPAESDKNNTKKLMILMDLWQLHMYRLNLDKQIHIEIDWLSKIEKDLSSSIQEYIEQLGTDLPSERSIVEFAQNGINNPSSYSQDDILFRMFEVSNTAYSTL